MSVDGGREIEVTAGGSMIPVARTVTGAVITVRLAIGAVAAPDPRLRLDAGIVLGGGVMLTVTQEKSHTRIPNGPYATVAPATRPPAGQAADEVTLFPDDSYPHSAGPAARIPAGPDDESWFRTEAQPSRPAMRVTQPMARAPSARPSGPSPTSRR